MIISKEKMVIELEENVDKLILEIQELLKVKELLINSSQYKLLYGKTQMIGEEQENIRARLEHSQNISRIAQDIVGGIYDECATEEQKKSTVFILNKTKELLYTEIGSLGHDIGHTPFGHNGERTVNEFIQKITDQEQINKIIQKRIKYFGKRYEEAQGHIGDHVTLSFEHNEQSALLFYELLNNGEINLDIIDRDRIVKAILAHSTTRVTECPEDLVAQVIRHTDKIEYRNMDFDEVGKYIKPEKYTNRAYAEKTSKERIEIIKKDLIKEAIQKGKIDDNMKSLEELKQLRKDYEHLIFFLEDGRKGLLTSENIERNRAILSKLLEYYYNNPDKIYDKYLYTISPINTSQKGKIKSVYDNDKDDDITKVERTINFILSMDNKRVKNKYLQLVKQRIIKEEGIEPVTKEEIEAIRQKEEEDKIKKWQAKELEKSSQPHTENEIRNMIRMGEANFVNEMLTQEGLEKIYNSKRKMEEENTLDILLYEQMEKADLARKYKRKERNYDAINEILGKPLLSEEERRRKAARQVKEKWQQQQGSQGEQADGPEGR